MNAMQVLDVLLVLGFTLRLARLVITDDVGLWAVRGPASLWAQRHDSEPYASPDEVGSVWVPRWRSKAVSGLLCPFCVGFWLGCVVLASLWLLGGPGHAPDWWRYLSGVFTLNWCAAHIGSRLGDAGYADEE